MITARRVVVLTGGTGKVGQYIAHSLAEKGNDLALVVRNTSKGKSMAAELMELYPYSNVEVLIIELLFILFISLLKASSL
jgi:short-subunit dehydrogenase